MVIAAMATAATHTLVDNGDRAGNDLGIITCHLLTCMVVVAVCNDDGDESDERTMMPRHHQLSNVCATAASGVALMLVHEMTTGAWLAKPNNDRLDMMSWHHWLSLVCCATAGVQQLQRHQRCWCMTATMTGWTMVLCHRQSPHSCSYLMTEYRKDIGDKY